MIEARLVTLAKRLDDLEVRSIRADGASVTVGSGVECAAVAQTTRELLQRRFDIIERRVELLARTFSDADMQRLLAGVRARMAAADIALQRSTPESMARAAAALEEAESSLNTLQGGRTRHAGGRNH